MTTLSVSPLSRLHATPSNRSNKIVVLCICSGYYDAVASHLTAVDIFDSLFDPHFLDNLTYKMWLFDFAVSSVWYVVELSAD